MEIEETLYVTNRQEYRKWLAKHYKTKKEIWLIYYIKSSRKPTIPYNDSVEEAICYGWIDGQVRNIDEGKFARRFTPRHKESIWSEHNKNRAIRMLEKKRMTKAGMAVLPDDIMSRWNKLKSSHKKRSKIVK